MFTVDTLILKQENDLLDFRQSISSLSGKPGTRQFIGELERRVTEANSSIAILMGGGRKATLTN